jgi:hypothetical protein
MSMLFSTSGRIQQIDELLLDVTRAIQLPPERREYAKRLYAKLSTWLERPGGRLRKFRVLVYAQGSQAIDTTNQPWGRSEFDLDSVVELGWFDGTPGELLRLLRDELDDNSEFAPRVTPLKRGWRLEFPGLFHIDLIPGRSDQATAPQAIEIPDRNLRDWSSSNPRGFAQWFEGRCEEVLRVPLLKAAAPFPEAEAAERKAVLKQGVQLGKRARDVVFKGAEGAPRSIVWTTLCGLLYEGQESRFATLCGVLDRILLEIDRAGDKPIEVRNPTNHAECFSECWDKKPAEYAAFVSWVRWFRARLVDLEHAEGLPEIAKILELLFGENVAGRAVSEFTKRMHVARETGSLRMGKGAVLTTVAGTGRAIPSHRFFGRRP